MFHSKIVLSLVVHCDMEIVYFGIKTTFFYKFFEELYMDLLWFDRKWIG
jgi:hypothetical protein